MYPGSTSDISIYLDSEFPELLQKYNVYAIADSIYGDTCPGLVTAKNTRHAGPADPNDVELRIAQDLHSHRACVEHFNARLHKWTIMDERIFRKSPELFGLYFLVCCQLTELKRRFKVNRKNKQSN